MKVKTLEELGSGPVCVLTFRARHRFVPHVHKRKVIIFRIELRFRSVSDG